ncbi:MAG: T9SS type A sorting domain-containing protein [Bacteroidales bacterium]|nr:T9SS type A sorting domain-containing protein [Bacteroidales bacterium]MDD4602509.1 T9SS type A sorting domain-containing protein [Bacteroidales bacterium]
MLKYIFFFTSIFLSASVSAQTYFNHRFEYGQPGWWDGASNIFQLPDGYILSGLYQYYCPLCLGFYKIDFQGNKIFSKTYCDSTIEYQLGNSGSIIRFSSDSILAVGSSRTPSQPDPHDQAVLYFLNNDFDTLSTKKLGEKTEPFDTGYYFNQLKLDPLKYIIITGSQSPYTGKVKILLMKIDNNGNQIWMKLFSSGQFLEGYSVICTNDGGYAIGGYAYDVPIPPDYSGDPILVKTDSAGNQQWMLNLGGPLQDQKAMICNSMDGNIIVGTSYCDSMPGGSPSASGNAYRRINIIKVDNSGNILWNKKYGSSEMFNELMNIRETGDGGLIACGYTTRLFPTTYDYAGWMLKTDSEGDSVWYRQYVICGGETSWNWLSDVIQTDDKGFIAGGIVYVHLPDTGSHDGWVLKVDSLGCENPSYCWVGMQPETEMPGTQAVKIFPNPADKLATISLINDSHELPVKIRLFDMFGREVKTIEDTQGHNDFQLDVIQIPEGLYMVLVESQHRVFGRTKLMVRKKPL